MSRLLSDTSAYSAFMRGHSDIKMALQRAAEIFLSPIVLGELHAGFRQGSRREQNERRLALFMESPRVKILAVADETAQRYAEIINFLWKAGTPIPTHDIWVAASAMEHGLQVLTTDAHFTRLPQILVEFYEPNRRSRVVC